MSVTNPFVFDFETSVIPDVGDYAEFIPRPPARMKDPEKIAAWIEERTAKQAQFAALDLDLARIVCACWSTDGKRLHGGIAKNADEERDLLAVFWKEAVSRTYVGFNILDFDLPLAIRRSQYLGVTHPVVSVDRYRHSGVEDLVQILTWNGKVPYRKLEFYCRRFGIKMPVDKFNGADIPTLVARGTDEDWNNIKRHCAADVKKEWRLAARIGVIDMPAPHDPNEPF